jgi:hypothetical protein
MKRHRPTFDAAFQFGDIVKLVVGDAEERGMVTGYVVRPTGLTYYVNWTIRQETAHYEIELQLAEEPSEATA